MRLLVIGLCLAVLPACKSGLASCGEQGDITGSWEITASPLAGDAGVARLPAPFTIDAELVQGGKTDFLGIGHYVDGTLTASDPTVFATLMIPQLTHNNGGKSGAILGCTLGINVPIATPVSDDNVDQGPLRISLSGDVTQKGMMASTEDSDPTDDSTVVLASDASNTPRPFSWTAVQR